MNQTGPKQAGLNGTILIQMKVNWTKPSHTELSSSNETKSDWIEPNQTELIQIKLNETKWLNSTKLHWIEPNQTEPHKDQFELNLNQANLKQMNHNQTKPYCF